jgi:diguanylate cyclase (GGDEF)-like protein
MRESSGSSRQPGIGRLASSHTAQGGAPVLPKPAVLTLATLAAILLLSLHAITAPANNVRSAGIGYLCISLVMAGSGLAFWHRARLSQGSLRIRWTLISAASLAAGIGYFPSFTECYLGAAPVRQLPIVCFTASEALYLLATVLFFAGVARSVVLVDMLQVLLFVVLRFNLTYSSATRDHFALDHLLVGQLVALFLFLIATVACLGAASRAELRFLRTLSCFFGFRLIGYFASNQVGYVWFRQHCSTLWDLPGPVLFCGFSLYLLFAGRPEEEESARPTPLHSSSLLVRSLMPSFLALVNLMLGLLLLPISLVLAAAAISVSLVCYILRTSLLHAQVVEENTQLESRNEQLEGLAVRDPLTGIGNRRSLAGVYGRIQAVAGGASLSLLLIDIDHFKQANDTHGHVHGDKVLTALARKLEILAAAFPGSHSARMGGDEFALLLPDVSPHEASTMAEALRSRFSAPSPEPAEDRVTLSIGVASLRAAHDLPLETLVCYTDKALYRAKLLGRNRVEVQPVWEPGTADDEPTSPSLRAIFQQTAG